nr:hypothetical protein P5651_03265 [Bacillus subtilis]
METLIHCVNSLVKANGIVYLAEASDGHVALKVSDDSLSITSEVNVLKSFSKAQSVTMGAFFF